MPRAISFSNNIELEQPLPEIGSSDGANGEGPHRRPEELDRLAESVRESTFAVLALDREGRIALANAHLAEMFGYDEGDVLGASFEVLTPQRWRAGDTAALDVDRLVGDVLNSVNLPDNLMIETEVRISRIAGRRAAVASSLQDLLRIAVEDCRYEDGRISLSCDAEAEWCLFSIVDRSPATGNAALRDSPGETACALQRTEAGLAATRQLIEAGGGRLSVEPGGPGRSSTYRLWWPLAGT